jgi:hypothetical protein
MYVILGGLINSFGLELDEAVQQRLPESIGQLAFQKAFPRQS